MATTPGKLDITIILDRSGSMGVIWDDTVGGFNRLIEEQRRVEAGEARVTLITFNHNVTSIFTRQPLADIPPLTRDSYVPGGSTALLDAVGEGITALQARLKSDPVDQAMVVIVTDGQENASRAWAGRRREIAKRVGEMEKEGVEFIFLGANVDAFSEGRALGVSGDSSYSFTSSVQGIEGAYGTISARMTSTRTGDFTGQAKALARALKQARGGVPAVDSSLLKPPGSEPPKPQPEDESGDEGARDFFSRLRRLGRKGHGK